MVNPDAGAARRGQSAAVYPHRKDPRFRDGYLEVAGLGHAPARKVAAGMIGVSVLSQLILIYFVRTAGIGRNRNIVAVKDY